MRVVVLSLIVLLSGCVTVGPSLTLFSIPIPISTEEDYTKCK